MKYIKPLFILSVILLVFGLFSTCDLFSIKSRANESDLDGTVDVPIPPDTPTNLVTSSTTSSITITWDIVTAAEGYRLYRSTVSDGSFSQIGTDIFENTIYTDTGLGEGETYYYKVSAYNISGESWKSGEIVETTLITLTIINEELDGGYWDNDLPVLNGWTISTDGSYDTDANHPDPGYYDLRMVTGEYGSTGRIGSFNPWNNPGGTSVDRMEINQDIDVPIGSVNLIVVGSSTGYGTSVFQSNGRTEVYIDSTLVATHNATNTTDWTMTIDITSYSGTSIGLSIVRPGRSVTYGDVWWDSVKIE